ncbi:hypothetical protein FQR65_LT17074, partial [Abscondita terminalis]
VLLYVGNNICGGSIIHSLHILSAAHCLFDESGRSIQLEDILVVAGQIELSITASNITRHAEKIIVHEDYDNEALSNDIAIIK